MQLRSHFANRIVNQLVAIGGGKLFGNDILGRANGDNRISVIVPCHRVIRSDGQLSGYGGGLRRKQWLLDHERAS